MILTSVHPFTNKEWHRIQPTNIYRTCTNCIDPRGDTVKMNASLLYYKRKQDIIRTVLF